MTILALMSRWFFGSGWKLAGIAALAIVAGLFAARVSYWKNQAARVPVLTAEIADAQKRSTSVLNKLAEAERKRGAAEAALSAWQTYKSVTLEPIRTSGSHATASTNSVCLPSDADRGMRNAAIRKLLGPVAAGDAGGMPAAAATP